MQSSSVAASTSYITYRRRTDGSGHNNRRNYGPAPHATMHSNALQSTAKFAQHASLPRPCQAPVDNASRSAPSRDFHLDTFFNPVWMSGPYVFSFSKDGRIVRPETPQKDPYPGCNAASSRSCGAALSSSSPFGSASTRVEKPWKNVAITEQDDADFVAMAAMAKVRARAEAKAKMMGLVYTWPPKPQAAACVECDVLAGPRQRKVVKTRMGRETVVGPQTQSSAETDTRENVVPALSYGSSGESESESEVFKVGRRVVRHRKEDLMEKCVGFGRVARKASAPASFVLGGMEEGEGVNGWTRSKVDDNIWNTVIPETWVEDELTARLKAVLRMPDS